MIISCLLDGSVRTMNMHITICHLCLSTLTALALLTWYVSAFVYVYMGVTHTYFFYKTNQ